MNVFVLTTGRSGSLTFAKACGHITNYTSGHETRVGRLGTERLAYPDQHIEVDNRLAWFTGRLDATHGDAAFYVHLTRDDDATASSHVKRWSKRAMRSYRQGILWDVDPEAERIDVARDLNLTMNSNIELFLRDKTRTMHIDIADATSLFPEFWERIGAEGDLDAALSELAVKHHEGKARPAAPRTVGRPSRPRRQVRTIKLPNVLRRR